MRTARSEGFSRVRRIEGVDQRQPKNTRYEVYPKKHDEGIVGVR